LEKERGVAVEDVKVSLGGIPGYPEHRVLLCLLVFLVLVVWCLSTLLLAFAYDASIMVELNIFTKMFSLLIF
jgi:hypothetical protein